MISWELVIVGASEFLDLSMPQEVASPARGRKDAQRCAGERVSCERSIPPKTMSIGSQQEPLMIANPGILGPSMHTSWADEVFASQEALHEVVGLDFYSCLYADKTHSHTSTS